MPQSTAPQRKALPCPRHAAHPSACCSLAAAGRAAGCQLLGLAGKQKSGPPMSRAAPGCPACLPPPREGSNPQQLPQGAGRKGPRPGGSGAGPACALRSRRSGCLRVGAQPCSRLPATELPLRRELAPARPSAKDNLCRLCKVPHTRRCLSCRSQQSRRQQLPLVGEQHSAAPPHHAARRPDGLPRTPQLPPPPAGSGAVLGTVALLALGACRRQLRGAAPERAWHQETHVSSCQLHATGGGGPRPATAPQADPARGRAGC